MLGLEDGDFIDIEALPPEVDTEPTEYVPLTEADDINEMGLNHQMNTTIISPCCGLCQGISWRVVSPAPDVIPDRSDDNRTHSCSLVGLS